MIWQLHWAEWLVKICWHCGGIHTAYLYINRLGAQVILDMMYSLTNMGVWNHLSCLCELSGRKIIIFINNFWRAEWGELWNRWEIIVTLHELQTENEKIKYKKMNAMFNSTRLIIMSIIQITAIAMIKLLLDVVMFPWSLFSRDWYVFNRGVYISSVMTVTIIQWSTRCLKLQLISCRNSKIRSQVPFASSKRITRKYSDTYTSLVPNSSCHLSC